VAAGTVIMSVSAYVPDVPFPRLLAAIVIPGVLLIVLIWVAMWPVASWINSRRMRWFLEGRPPTQSEVERFAALPRFVARSNTIGWLFAPLFVVYLIHVQHFSLDGWEIARVIAGLLFGYVLGTALVYLLFERTFRPYLRAILPADVAEWPSSMGLGPRLLLAWFAVAGAPLLLIAFTLIGLTPTQRDQIAPAIRVGSILAVMFGLVVFVLAGRALTGPLERLRSAQRRVAGGDLTTHLDIDEAAEMGQLEAGFNEMVAGLRTLASKNHALQAELRKQLQAVQESRVRIVEATDAERVRIERNLHDGAQQRLLSVAFTVRAAERSVREGRRDAEQQIRTAMCELDAAMTELRELARGIHPAILDEEGLGSALTSLAERATLPVHVSARLPERVPTAVEVTAYFVVAEALTNIARHADASEATIEVNANDGVLQLRVCDDGKGGADPRLGSGLRGLSDRISALGGTFEVESSVGTGTTVSAQIPIHDARGRKERLGEKPSSGRT
jgi:signal transduction histidine kinase